MTLQECIDYVDSIEPNAYTNAQKAGWLNEVEGKVYTQLFLVQPYEFTPVTDGSRILALPAPHDRMYSLYLQAMIHYANGEYDRYANSMAVFNQAWGEANRWFGGDFDVTDRLRNRSFEVQITPDLGDMTIMEIPDGCAVVAGRIVVRKPEFMWGRNYKFTKYSYAQTYCYKIGDIWYSFDISGVGGLNHFEPGDRLNLFTDTVLATVDGGNVRIITPTANDHTGTELDWTCGIQAWVGSSDQTVGARQLLSENGSIPLPMIMADAGKASIGVTIGPGIWDQDGYDLYDGVIKLTGRLLVPAEKWYYDDQYARRRDARWHG